MAANLRWGPGGRPNEYGLNGMTQETDPRESKTAKLGFGLAVIVFSWHVAHSDFLIDDAFISFRYAANWADGTGLSFNPGEAPVEGYSNFLWVALLALTAKLGVPLEVGSRILSISAAAGTLLLAYRALAVRGFRPYAIAGASCSLALFPPFATWATGGLETALFGLIFFAALDRLTRPSGSHLPILVVTGITLPLVRTDGFAFAVALAIAVAIAGDREARRRLKPFLIASTSTLALYLVWRKLHYDAWIANTARAKTGLGPAVWARGLRTTASYLVVFGSPLLVLPALLPGLGTKRDGSESSSQRTHFVLAGALSCAAFAAYNTLVGGDWMPMFRMLAPASALYAVCLAGLAERLGKVSGTAVALGAGGLSLLPSFNLSVAPRDLRESLDFRAFKTGYQSERERWQRGVDNLRRFSTIGTGLAQIAEPEQTFTAGAIGAIGYYSGLTILDRNGLVDREVASLPGNPTGRSAGHDKRVPRSHFLTQRPDLFEALLVDRTIRGPESPGFRQAARALGAQVFADPDEAVLRDHALPEAFPLRAETHVPAEHSLIVLSATDDRARARALWKTLGL